MAAPLRDRLSFLGRLPALLKGTADDDVPCPGYLLEDIARIPHESAGGSQCLLEYLLQRLQSRSCRVKLKVLRVLLHTSARAPPCFLLQLRRNAALVREAAVFSGPPDPLHGDSLNRQVRAAAQELAALLFSDAPQPAAPPARPLPPAGMGSDSGSSSQGFGFSGDRAGSASAGEALLSSLQRAAAAVAGAVLAAPDGPRRAELRDDAYEPVRAPAATGSAPTSAEPPAATAPCGTRASHQPGLPGGGWEEPDSGRSSQGSSQGTERSPTCDSCSKSGSDSHSGASRELPNVAERVDADGLGDCARELNLVATLTCGARVFLTREEAQHFVKECGLLNCEVVLELLSRALREPAESVRMRALCAISALTCSDLLSPEQIFAATRQHLQQLSQGSPGAVANRATKILRQFEALCRDQPSPRSCGSDPAPCALTTGTPDLLTEPLPGQAVLEPVSTVPLPPAPCACAGSGAAAPPAPGEPQATGAPGGPAGAAAAAPCRGLSLFAGMELVARPGARLSQDCPPAAPRTLCPAGDPGAAGREPEGGREPSAFAFLNA